MAKAVRQWALRPAKQNKTTVSDSYKRIVNAEFAEMIEDFKQKCIKNDPNKEYAYLIDIFSKWIKNSFYICEKYKAEFENRIADEFESKLIRLEYTGPDRFNFSYFRHTGKWHVVAEGISLTDCKEMILDTPTFQPSQF